MTTSSRSTSTSISQTADTLNPKLPLTASCNSNATTERTIDDEDAQELPVTASIHQRTLMSNDKRLSMLVKLLVVDVWSDDIIQVQSCLDKMTNICETDENSVMELFQNGGHLVVIVMMRKYIQSIPIQIAALYTLQKASECRNEYTDAIVALGALECIIYTMQYYSQDEHVIMAACGTLLNLTLPAKHAKVFILELFGIQSLAATSMNFPRNIGIQKHVLSMLHCFSFCDEYKIPIVEQGGIHTLAIIIESLTSMNQYQDQQHPASHSTFPPNDERVPSVEIESILQSACLTMKRLL